MFFVNITCFSFVKKHFYEPGGSFGGKFSKFCTTSFSFRTLSLYFFLFTAPQDVDLSILNLALNLSELALEIPAKNFCFDVCFHF